MKNEVKVCRSKILIIFDLLQKLLLKRNPKKQKQCIKKILHVFFCVLERSTDITGTDFTVLINFSNYTRN